MRLPFPEYISLFHASCFAILLCIAQLVEGTDPVFSICCFLFIVIATLAFNLAGGLSRPSGAYVFFYAILAVIFGLFWKACLGEPADSNLTHPLLTIEAHLGGIAAMFGAVFLSRKFTTKRAFLADLISDDNMLNASFGCMVVGLALTLTLWVVPYKNGSILSALSQLNRFLEISLILGVIYQIRKSGGRSSVNLPVLISGGAVFAFGLLSFSKQGMFTPFVCWIIAAASQRYRISFYQALCFILWAVFMVYYLVPYSQYGRNFSSPSLSEQIDTSISFLSDLGHVRQEYEEVSRNQEDRDTPHYYNTPQGLFDRLQMLSLDDALVDVTENHGPFGLLPIIMQVENMVPHVLWPNKPTVNFGNLYAHEIGMIGPEDFTTGVSFSPVGEAFRVGRWMGVFVVAPVLWTMAFILYDSLCGDVRKYPWGLFALVLIAHAAPEQLLGGIIYMLGYGAAGIVFVAVVASYFMPVLGSLFVGRQRTELRRIGPIRSIPRSVPAVQSSRSSGR